MSPSLLQGLFHDGAPMQLDDEGKRNLSRPVSVTMYFCCFPVDRFWQEEAGLFLKIRKPLWRRWQLLLAINSLDMSTKRLAIKRWKNRMLQRNIIQTSCTSFPASEFGKYLGKKRTSRACMHAYLSMPLNHRVGIMGTGALMYSWIWRKIRAAFVG